MMLILISLLVILFVLSIFFRKQITNLTGTVKDYAIGNWYRTYPIFRKALIFGGVGWLILIVLMIGIGAYANSITAALIISILFPFWFVSMLIPRRTVPSPAKWRIPIFEIIRVFGGFVLLIASLLLAIGLWSPDTKGALNERSDDSKVWTANFFKKGSAHSERNAGVRARTKSATGVYDDFRKQIKGKIISSGTIVMVDLQKSKPATEDSEALMLVMLPNEHKNYVGGEKVWIPTLKLEFINNEEQETSTANTKLSAANAIPGESWRMCWQEEKKEQWCGDVVVLKTSDQVKIRGTCEDGSQFFFTGDQTMEKNSYQGIWNNRNWKEAFFLAFDLESQSAKGWFRDQESHKNVPMWLNKKG
jgi:hypothetical protein